MEDDEFYSANLMVTLEQNFDQTMASALEESETEESFSTPEEEISSPKIVSEEDTEPEVRPSTPATPTFQPFALSRTALAPMANQTKPFEMQPVRLEPPSASVAGTVPVRRNRTIRWSHLLHPCGPPARPQRPQCANKRSPSPNLGIQYNILSVNGHKPTRVLKDLIQ